MITFKEMVSSLRKGSLRRQIEKLASDRFEVVNEMGPITIQSVKVSIEDDCIRIMPEMSLSIETEGEKEHVVPKRFTHQCTHQKPKRKVKRDSIGLGQICSFFSTVNPLSAINMTLSKEHKQHKLIEQTRIINPSAHRQAINDELEKCFASRRQAKDDNESNDKQPDNTKVSVKALREKFADKLEISCGYKWHRDYESTDDESLWQRIGFGLSLMSTPRSESNSVSSGDYCVHHYDH